jgi:endonuclease/exonuclease/phosphatase family metal-dependent hydrolase
MKDTWKHRVSLILDKAIDLDSDFINLQEICSYQNESMNDFILSYLKKKTGSAWYSNTHFMHLAWDKYDEFIGLYTKHIPQKVESGFLPNSPLPRAYVATKLNGIWYVGVHLEHSNEWGHFRKAQIDFLLNKFGNKKAILMGDFNSGFDWPEQKIFRTSNWKPFFPGLTYPSHKPYKGIDGFWMSPSLKANVNKVNMLLNKPTSVNNKLMYLSDHFGVFMKFQEL